MVRALQSLVERLLDILYRSLQALPCFAINDRSSSTDWTGTIASNCKGQTMTAIFSIPLRFGRIAATLPVSDMTVASELYNTVFGFECVFENGDPTGFMILKRDDAELHLTLQKGHKAANFNVAHMMVSDAEAVHQLCQANDLRIIKRIQDKEYGLRAFVFADRDGNRIDVGQAL